MGELKKWLDQEWVRIDSSGNIKGPCGTSKDKKNPDKSLDVIDSACARLRLKDVKTGKIDHINNPLKQSPHTLKTVTSDDWDRPYSRKEAAYPLPDQEKYKFWPSVSRINNAYGDRNLICSCPSVLDLENVNSL